MKSLYRSKAPLRTQTVTNGLHALTGYDSNGTWTSPRRYPMRVARLLLTLIIVFSSSPRVNSQQSLTVPVRDAQAVAILQSALASLGGTAQTAPASIVASGTYTRFLADSTTVSLPLRAEVLGYDKFRWEVD